MRCMHWVWIILAGLAPVWADVSNCACDPAQPKSLEGRECSLTREAMKQSTGASVFYLKDNNPRKPGRWLALPTYLGPGCNFVHKLPAKVRVELFEAAVAKARELFGENWGIAYNGVKMRTQCHFHIHLGKFIPASETGKFRVVRSVREIPALEEGGVWVHPVKGGLHVHEGEQISETVLVR